MIRHRRVLLVSQRTEHLACRNGDARINQNCRKTRQRYYAQNFPDAPRTDRPREKAHGDVRTKGQKPFGIGAIDAIWLGPERLDRQITGLTMDQHRPKRRSGVR